MRGVHLLEGLPREPQDVVLLLGEGGGAEADLRVVRGAGGGGERGEDGFEGRELRGDEGAVGVAADEEDGVVGGGFGGCGGRFVGGGCLRGGR